MDPAKQPTPNAPSMSIKPYHSITGKQRLGWMVSNTIGPETLVANLFGAAWSTAENEPKEYGGTWEGFGKRYGMKLAGVAASNTMEGGLGAIWKEDPRYFPTYGQPFKGRVRNVLIMTVLAHNRNGALMPAYARYMAIPGSNFLSNTWRADSEADTHDALLRTMWGFLGLLGKNSFTEFWPDVHRKVLHGKF